MNTQKLKKIFEEKDWVIGLIIFLLALILRLIVAFKLAWRPSEINYVDWVGEWFTAHFWQYLFQFFQKVHPPESPIFANPPFGLSVLTLGIVVAQKLHFSALIGARLINVLIGSLTGVYIFYLGRKWFNVLIGLIAGISFSLMPVLITNNGSAYLDTILALLVLISIDLTFGFLKKRRKSYLYWLGLVLGLSLLTKFVVLPIVATILILIFFNLKEKNYRKYFLILLIIVLLTPIILWSGFRDIQNLKTFWEVYWKYGFYPYPLSYSTSPFFNYLVIIVGVLPPMIFLGFLASILILIKRFVAKDWQRLQNLYYLLILIAGYLVVNNFLVGYTTAHQLVTILPLILFLAAWGIDEVLNFLPAFLKKSFLFFILISLILPLLPFKPQFLGIYGSLFVGGSNNAFRLYSNGSGGEEVPQIAKWFKENTPPDSRIGVVIADWLFPKYDGDRNYSPLFLSDGLEGAYSRGYEYVVIPRVYLEINGRTQADFSKMDPVFILRERNIVLAKVYKLDYSRIKIVDNVSIGSENIWRVDAKNNNPVWAVKNGELKISYQFTKSFPDANDPEDNRFVFTQENSLAISAAKGIYFEALGDGEAKLFQIALRKGDDSFVYNLEQNWKGWKQFYVPLDYFVPSKTGNSADSLDFGERYNLAVVVISRKPAEGQVGVRNFRLAILENK